MASAFIPAERFFQRALSIFLQSLEPNHPDIATTLRGYAVLLRKMDREAEAISLEERVDLFQG